MKTIIKDNKVNRKHLIKLINKNCVSKVKELNEIVISSVNDNDFTIIGAFINENGLKMKFRITISDTIKNVKIFIKSIDK